MSLSYPTQALCTTNVALPDPRIQWPPGCLLALPWDPRVTHLKQPKHLLPNPSLLGPHLVIYCITGARNLGRLGYSSLLTHPGTADPPEWLMNPFPPPQTRSPCPGPWLSFPTQILLQLPPWSLVSPLPSSLHMQQRDLLKHKQDCPPACSEPSQDPPAPSGHSPGLQWVFQAPGGLPCPPPRSHPS